MHKIPITDKITFRINMSEFYNVKCQRKYEFSTSGSSGIPIKISYDKKSLLNYLAITQRQRKIAEKFASNKKKIFIVRTIPYASAYKFEKYIHEILFIPKLFRKKYQYYDIQLPLNYLIDTIQIEKPSIVASYGSFVSFFAKNLRTCDEELSYPDVFIYSSDNCPTNDLKFLLKRGICVLSNYTCAESISIAYQKEPLGDLLIHEDAVYLWNDENNNIILTNLVNNGTILLNYNLEDIGYITYDSENYRPIVQNLEGSTSCSLLLKGGKIIPYTLIDHFFELNGIIQFQIFQKDTSHLKIKIVTQKNFDQIKNIVENKFRKLFKYDVEIEIENVSEIKREKSGKFRPIISQLSEH